jgi:sucrose-phosphate synthase
VEKHSDQGLYLVLISVHGLIRGHDLELGRDADTGGQTLYVVEVARALAERPEVAQVDLVTRLVRDPAVSEDYAQHTERLADKARIVRIEAGPDAYIPKEQLWDHLDVFADHLLDCLRQGGRLPDIVHSHYADAGYVGSRVANHLGVPLVHTGHSLGRDKRRRLRAAGLSRGEIETVYNMRRRIEAEEETLANATLVITSTTQEIEDQYGRYDFYDPGRMTVVPPGTDVRRFQPPNGSEQQSEIYERISCFLRDPHKPMILALSRPDARKNISTLIKAYGGSEALQQAANLVVIAGNRDDIRALEPGPRDVWTELLVLIDAFELYTRVAYPKHHTADEVPIIYRIAAASRGVFINPALTEPFGLTLIEAAASGLPIVATEDGGPRDIIDLCKNGHLIDPLEEEAMAQTLLDVISDAERWESLARNGLDGVTTNYSWDAHAGTYLERIRSLVERAPHPIATIPAGPVQHRDRVVVVELDQLLRDGAQFLGRFLEQVKRHRRRVGFGIVTGRGLKAGLQVLKRHRISTPDVILAALGTELYYGRELSPDEAWADHIDHLWAPRTLRRVLDGLPGLKLQPQTDQRRFKLSYYVDAEKAPDLDEINRLLRQAEQSVHVALSHGQYLDLTPPRASKGFALRWVAEVWDIPLERILVVGGTASDEDMLRGNTLGAVLANPHAEELSALQELDNVHFTTQEGPAGVLEAIAHYDFFGACRVPEQP